MAAWYKNQGKTLVDALNAVYEKYGYYLDALDSFVLKGKDGAEKIGALMQTFRAAGIKCLRCGAGTGFCQGDR